MLLSFATKEFYFVQRWKLHCLIVSRSSDQFSDQEIGLSQSPLLPLSLGHHTDGWKRGFLHLRPAGGGAPGQPGYQGASQVRAVGGSQGAQATSPVGHKVCGGQGSFRGRALEGVRGAGRERLTAGGALGARRVVALVLAEVVLADEALAADRAGEGPHARVRSVVVDELGALGEALLALGAGEGPLARVQHAVADEVGRPREAAPALAAPQGAAVPRAPRGPGRPVRRPAAALVRAQADLQLEALAARGAGERPAARGRCRVLLQAWLVAEAFCPARVLTGVTEGSWGLAGVQHCLSVVRGGVGQPLRPSPGVQAHRRFTPEIPAPADPPEEPVPWRGLILGHGRAKLTQVPLRPGGLSQPQHRVLAGEGAALALPGSFLDRTREKPGGLAWSEQGSVGL